MDVKKGICSICCKARFVFYYKGKTFFSARDRYSKKKFSMTQNGSAVQVSVNGRIIGEFQNADEVVSLFKQTMNLPKKTKK